MSKAKGFDLLPQTPAIAALREWAEATDFAKSQAAAHAYCVAMEAQTGDPFAGLQDLARVIGESLGRAGLPINTKWRLRSRPAPQEVS